MAIERTHGKNNAGGGGSPDRREGERPATPTKEEWNRHCFQIVHTKHVDNVTTPQTTTRIFTAPVQDRNEWVFALNNALMGHERRLGKARKATPPRVKKGTDCSMLGVVASIQSNSEEQEEESIARKLGVDRSILCNEDDDEEDSDEIQLQMMEQQPQQRTPWRDSRRHGSDVRVIRSISPTAMDSSNAASLGLPPTNPRRRSSLRSPSPIRLVRSMDAAVAQ